MRINTRTHRRLKLCAVLVLVLLSPAATLPVHAQVTAQPLAITLQQFLAMVEDHSLDLSRARTERRQAANEEAIARSATRPSLDARAGYTRNLIEIESTAAVGADAPVGGGFAPLVRDTVTVSSDNEVSAGVSLQQLLFDLRVFRALEASRQFIAFSDTNYEVTRQAVLTAAKKLFFRTILLQEVLEVRRASEELALENFQDVQQRHDAGVVAPLDLLRAELNWKTTIPETSQADRNLQIALSNLRNIAGIDLEQPIRLEGSLTEYPVMPDFPSLAQALAERPDYRALQGMRSLREIEVAAGRAEFYPTLSGSLNWNWSAADDGFSFDEDTRSLTAGLMLQIPIYAGGGRAARMRRAQLEVEQTDTSIQQKINDVQTELRNIELTLAEASERIEFARQALETAELAYSITEISAESGVATQLELKDARVSLVQAQLTHYSAIFDYLSAYFDWQAAVGRGADGL